MPDDITPNLRLRKKVAEFKNNKSEVLPSQSLEPLPVNKEEPVRDSGDNTRKRKKKILKSNREKRIEVGQRLQESIVEIGEGVTLVVREEARVQNFFMQQDSMRQFYTSLIEFGEYKNKENLDTGEELLGHSRVLI